MAYWLVCHYSHMLTQNEMDYVNKMLWDIFSSFAALYHFWNTLESFVFKSTSDVGTVNPAFLRNDFEDAVDQ